MPYCITQILFSLVRMCFINTSVHRCHFYNYSVFPVHNSIQWDSVKMNIYSDEWVSTGFCSNLISFH